MRQDPEAYIPHRASMSLLDKVLILEDEQASAEVVITKDASFYKVSQGVPAWVGLEYMGQTAALIGGRALQEGRVKPHVGMLLGTRKYSAGQPYFRPGQRLHIQVKQAASVGEELANFTCEIIDAGNDTVIANSRLSVYRRFTDA